VASLPLGSPLAPPPPPIPQVIGGAFNSLLTDRTAATTTTSAPPCSPQYRRPPSDCFSILSPPRESPARFPTTGTAGTSVLSTASPLPIQPNPKSSFETRTHSSGGRWRGGRERPRHTLGPTRPLNHRPLHTVESPQGPSSDSPQVLSPRPHTVSHTVRHCGRSGWSPLPLNLPNTTPNTTTVVLHSTVSPLPLNHTLLVSLSSPHIPDSGASHILLRSCSLPSLSQGNPRHDTT
jgi:hypothetical protein